MDGKALYNSPGIGLKSGLNNPCWLYGLDFIVLFVQFVFSFAYESQVNQASELS